MIPFKEQIHRSLESGAGLAIPGVIQFKTKGERDEFLDERMSTRLQLITLALATFVRLYQKGEIVVTEVWRSEEERKAIYPKGHRLHERVGAHERWEAIDIRTWNLEALTFEAILSFFSHTNIPQFRGLMIYHKVSGNVHHFHIQLRRS